MGRLILQALSHSPANKARPRLNHVGWKIGFLGLKYITSEIPPSADLSPFIQTINFDFFWRNPSNLCTHAKEMICWLKKCPTPPEDLITLWEDCCFFIDCDREISEGSGPIAAHLSDAACHTILSQSPGLLRIFRPCGCAEPSSPGCNIYEGKCHTFGFCYISLGMSCGLSFVPRGHC
ncbi:hypothetical protein FB451DRAFT_186277 [Mycena latifolia]|nr:hypothetical protein FB451DRAFT_186277 [Mycena latifolia]